MKRQELMALLHGVENLGEIIDQIIDVLWFVSWRSSKG